MNHLTDKFWWKFKKWKVQDHKDLSRERRTCTWQHQEYFLHGRCSSEMVNFRGKYGWRTSVQGGEVTPKREICATLKSIILFSPEIFSIISVYKSISSKMKCVIIYKNSHHINKHIIKLTLAGKDILTIRSCSG